jgi:L-threonylcarbamoyladenylate synthase
LSTADLVGEAVDVLRQGGLVGMPTETVYGLAADASNVAAVRRIFAVKARPDDHPLIVHLADASAMGAWASSIPRAAATLAEACWPGPLTVLVPRGDHVLDVVTGGRATVGLRVPAHPMALDLLRRFGTGLAAPSANRFGQVSPTTAAHVRADLGDEVDLVLDGGACPVGVESTIVDCTVGPPQILRPGGIPDEQIARLLEGVSGLAAAAGTSRASGMLTSHYAPRAAVEVFESLASATARAEALAAEGRLADVLDPTLDIVVAAQQLYVWLRAADERNLDVLCAVLPAAAGLGHAIRDRLLKAAGRG